MMQGVDINSLEIIDVNGGDVMHALKASNESYNGFGEAYFSNIDKHAIKAWKRHTKMTLNLIVPVGKIRFVIYDDRVDSDSFGKFQKVILSKDNYQRLTVGPMLWVGFQGLDRENILLNIADIEHNPKEVDKRDVREIKFNWSN
jgi:dTDP-4-dehydrorhamnose 3,5-epimerase